MTAIAPVRSSGVGVRNAQGWAIRLASFRLDPAELGGVALGVVTSRCAASAALVGLLSGRTAPAYGSLRVLGYDVGTLAGRAAVRARVGVAAKGTLPWPGIKIRGLVDRAAKLSGQPASARHLLVAAIIDRLALTPWADVPLRAVPELVAAKTRLAAACVHQPELLIVDGLLDHLSLLDRTVLIDVLRALTHDTPVVVLGRDADVLLLLCDQLAVLARGILIGSCLAPVRSPAAAASAW
ncbi:MAG TPA: hypothetical protein VNF47_01065 [Streptosporangiaceae bacterium]|nr:hypothetical protein [Streptosporangiaceae bacterium]